MRAKRSEISVLSIASLDVFASALGVFIIISAVSLPFLFNTSQLSESDFSSADEIEARATSTEDLVQDLKDALNGLLEKLERLESEISSLEADSSEQLDDKIAVIAAITSEVAELQKQIKSQQALIGELQASSTALIPPIDLVVLLDTTGSMTGYLRDLQASVFFLAKILTEWSESPAIGIIEVLDQCDYGNRKRFDVTKVDSVMVKKFENFVYSLGQTTTGCNIDKPEAIHLALQEALALEWRSEVKKRIIIIISDNPPYDHKVAASYKMVKEFVALDSGNSVSVVHPDTRGYRTVAEQRMMKSLAEGGNGQYIDASGSFLGAILLAIK